MHRNTASTRSRYDTIIMNNSTQAEHEENGRLRPEPTLEVVGLVRINKNPDVYICATRRLSLGDYCYKVLHIPYICAGKLGCRWARGPSMLLVYGVQ